MSGTEDLFVEPPRIETHRRPFAFARMSEDYAHDLAELAERLAPGLERLPPKESMLDWAGPFGARFSRYNLFLLDPAFDRLLLALRATYRALMEAMQIERRPRLVHAWMNIQKEGERIGRHLHHAPFIGTFAARARGSDTRYGLGRARNDNDLVVPNRDGQLIVTPGKLHYHETSPWPRADAPRVTFAFDIVTREGEEPDSLRLPFDC
jgi:hypothetical protein